jgi:predicted AlkP superfamily pyrophosphatase or phosphodiesterase
MVLRHGFSASFARTLVLAALAGAILGSASRGQTAGGKAGAQAGPKAAERTGNSPARPKLVVVLVVDQMRADYVDKFQGQWTGGLKRLVKEGAWFREAAYPYAATETCVGHSTISTGALPETHGMIANAWFDRETQKMVTCTADPNAKNSGYAGVSVKGGDSPWRMQVPAFADELKFQGAGGAATRVVTFSLKARAAITMGGRLADAATWFDGATGALSTSSAYKTQPFIEEYATAHPVKADIGKTWSLSLPESAYFYDEKATHAGPPAGWEATFPHALRGKGGSGEADPEFYEQWASSPFADTYLTKIAETAVDALRLGKSGGTDYLGVSYSSVDYVGHEFGPRSWEIQDVLVRLDQDLADLFAHLDKQVGRENYVVALSADHGVAPIPEDMKKSGEDAGWLNMAEVRERVEKALKQFHYGNPAVAGAAGSELYFASGVYERLKADPGAMQAAIDAIQGVPGVARVYRREELEDRPATGSPMRKAFALSYFAWRSGDLLVVPKVYWPVEYNPAGKEHAGGTTHGTPYYYDQRVPLLLMGWGVQTGEYYGTVTPADIAPTLGALCGITLATRDGRVLGEALSRVERHSKAKAAQAARP